MIRTALIAPALALLFLAGCSLHQARSPEATIEPPQGFAEAKAEPVAPPVGRWWEDFEDPRLNSLMEEAFENNLDLEGAYQRLVQARAAFSATGALEGPALDLNARGGRARQSGRTSDTYSLSLAAGYEVDLWRRLSSRTEAAGLEAEASSSALETLYISVSARLADLYYLATEQRAQLELVDRTIDNYRETLELVMRRYSEGLVPSVDVYQARQSLARARAGRPEFSRSLAETTHAIAVLLGRFPQEELGLGGSALPRAPEFALGLPSEVLKARPDVRAALLRVRAADSRVAAAVADRFPVFNLVGEYGGASSTLSTILDSPNVFWNAVVAAALPVVDSGRRKAEVRRAEAVYGELLAEYQRSVLEAMREVEDALVGIRTTRERIARLEENVDAARNALNIALDRYTNGLTDYLPVLTEQQRLYEAERDLLSARRTLVSETISLARALGNGWTEREAAERASLYTREVLSP